MLRQLICVVPYLAAQIAIAVEIDPEPNWETAVYSCPMSVKTLKGEYSLSMFSVFDVKANDWYELAPEQRKHVYYRHLENDDIYLVCKYGGETEILVRAKDAVACGGNGKPGHLVCWTTDPYATKK